MRKLERLRAHQGRMISLLRDRKVRPLTELCSFISVDAVNVVTGKYRNEVRKRLERVFPWTINHLKPDQKTLFRLANDFHFELPPAELMREIERIGKALIRCGNRDPVLQDLVQLELRIANILYRAESIPAQWFGVPITFQTSLWRDFPNTSNARCLKKPVHLRFDYDPKTTNLHFFADPFQRSEQEGDPHHFGKRTRLNASGTHFHKPRELRWEWLLLSKQSPLRTLMPTDIQSSLFRLEISLRNSTSKRIKTCTPNFSDSRVWRNSGRLAAWCVIWGIGDLHLGNLVMTRQGPVVIDVETALCPMETPFDTGLLDPRYPAYQWSQGFAPMLEYFWKNPSHEAVECLIQGYVEVLREVGSVSRHILEMLNDKKLDISGFRNRFILRNSREYQNPRAMLIAEEKIQIRNGDVPYFFTVRSKRGVFFFSDREGTWRPVQRLPRRLQALQEQHHQPISGLLTRSRLESLAKRGSIELRRYFQG